MRLLQELPASLSSAVGIVFVLFGTAAVWLIFEASRRTHSAMNGISIPYSCRQGQCGTCATRLLSGEIKMDCEDGLQPALRSQGYILTCVARAQGNVRLDV